MGKRTMSMRVQRALRLAVAPLLAVGWAGLVLPSAAAASPAASSPAVREAAIAQWDDAAAARGAVGTYFDAATGELVALLPASSSGAISSSDASSLVVNASSAGMLARVERATIDKPTIASIQGALAALRPSISQDYVYASYFDASQQKVVLESNAPATMFAGISAKYGDKNSICQRLRADQPPLGLDSALVGRSGRWARVQQSRLHQWLHHWIYRIARWRELHVDCRPLLPGGLGQQALQRSWSHRLLHGVCVLAGRLHGGRRTCYWVDLLREHVHQRDGPQACCRCE